MGQPSCKAWAAVSVTRDMRPFQVLRQRRTMWAWTLPRSRRCHCDRSQPAEPNRRVSWANPA